MNANFVIMGLPASGKTTFLAALWHLIESKETETRIQLDRYEGDLTYLNQIAQAWRTFKEVPRTSQVGDQDIVIHLHDTETSVRGAAYFPDLAGETFDAQVEGRRCRPKFLSDVAEGDGILFFIGADRKEDDLSIIELNKRLPPEALIDVPGEVPADGVAEAGAEETKRSEWRPKEIPAQVRVVQLLSDFLRTPFEVKRRRLVIIISAWDLVAASGITPENWIKSNMPLLSQFLASNFDAFDPLILGVSAQGVSLDDDNAIERIADVAPSRRISVVSGTGVAHDLTLPLVWLMTAS